MVLAQGLFVGLIGYALGLGLASLIEWVMLKRMTTIPPVTFMAWQIPVGTAVAVAIIVVGTTMFSLRRVLVLEPASVFK
jgi:putative ABC transport system permease protein